MKMAFRLFCSLMLLAGTSTLTYAVPLYQSTFEQGADAWQPINQATVSTIGRRAGTKSLLISQWKDEDVNSSWISPPITAPGKPITLSFWAADNYHTCRDFTYAACVDIVSYDKDGKELASSDSLVSVAWDDNRKENMWGQYLPTGLVWKYYQRTVLPTGAAFRLKFHWPKIIVRGDCYLTDVVVTEATPEEIAASAPGAKTVSAEEPGTLGLELCTNVAGNLFAKSDPLAFEVIAYAKDNATKIAVPAGAQLRYEISDYPSSVIARGQCDFADAQPIADQAYYQSRFGAQQKQNLHKVMTIPDAAARAIGREFFLKVALVANGQVLATDTVPYGVVDPRAISAADYANCHFTSSYFTSVRPNDFTSARPNDAIAQKTGISWSQEYDYSWVRRQPHYPGPINVEKRPAFPNLIWCPNIEQERPVAQWIKDEVPPEAIIDDPLHPGHITFKIDPYVEYIVEYVRQNRAAIKMVVPSGLERPIDDRTIELAKKAYVALKKEFPDLQVGIMLYGLPMNPSADVDIFLKEKLYDYCDFIDTHVYASSVDWSEWERLQQAYVQMGRKPVPLISTEFCRVGGMDQVQKSRDMITAHLDAFAHGMNRIYYFNQYNPTGEVPKPFLREPTDLGGDMFSGFMYVQMVKRSMGNDMLPLLQTMTYYNLVQNFEAATYRKTITPDDNTLGYIFDRDHATALALWLTKPVGVRTFLVKSPVGFRVQDLYGRTERMSSGNGGVLISVDENPLTLLFDARAEQIEIIPVEGGLSVAPVARGAKGTAEITIPSALGHGGTVRVACTSDGTWPAIKEQTLTLKQGKETRITLPFAVDLNTAVGRYPLTARVYAGKELVALLTNNLPVADLLTVAVDTIPLTKTSEPALTVAIHSLQDTTSKGTVIVDDRYFAAGLRNQLIEKPYTVPPHGSVTVILPVNRALVNLSTSYTIPVTVVAAEGIRVTKEEEVAFRACEKAPGPITIDGDLADWKLADRTAIPLLARLHRVGQIG